MTDTSDVDEAECTIYLQITNLAASALAATVCLVIGQLLQQATLLPVFALYFFEIFPESSLSRNVIGILDSLGAEKEAIIAVVKDALKKPPDGEDRTEDDGEEQSAIEDAHPTVDPTKGAEEDTAMHIPPDAVTSPTPVGPYSGARFERLDTKELPLGAQVPKPRLLTRTATKRTLLRMEKTMKEFKVPLGNFLSLDFHGYVVVASVIYCSTSMVTVAFILWDSETITHWYDGGFEESLSAYNIFLVLATIFGLATMLIFVTILNEVYTLDNLKEDGFTLESKSKATADALFWISTVTFFIALCIKWPYIIICLYVIAVLLLEVVLLGCLSGLRQLFFNPIWLRFVAPFLRGWTPWLFIDSKSTRIHSPTYFLIYLIVFGMNCVTQMSRKTIKIMVDKISLAINVSVFLYSVILFTFLLTVRNRDPEVVDICVSTSTIVVVAGYLGSAVILLGRPLLYLLYGESMLMHFDIGRDDNDDQTDSTHRFAGKRNSGNKVRTSRTMSMDDADPASVKPLDTATIQIPAMQQQSLSMGTDASSIPDRNDIRAQGTYFSIDGAAHDSEASASDNI